MGDLLRIDLTTGTTREETIPAERLRTLLGGKGIGARMLLEEVGPEVDPLGPENKLIFTTGPLSGTQMPGSNRYGVFFLSPQTGGYGEAYSGGNLAPQFAGTGYKVVVLEGSAPEPVFVEVAEGRAALHPADRPLGDGHLRGGGAHQGARRRPEGAGLRHRSRRREPAALRLHREQQVAQPRQRRRRRRHGVEERQGRRLPRGAQACGRAPRRLQGPHPRDGRGRRRTIPR